MTGSHTWISIWAVLSTILVLWDAGYCFTRSVTVAHSLLVTYIGFVVGFYQGHARSKEGTYTGSGSHMDCTKMSTMWVLRLLFSAIPYSLCSKLGVWR